jgi:uncharacterized protein (UPF0332 family)
MLDKERIKEAKTNVENYLKEGLLKKITIKQPEVRNILVNNCKESLKVAEILFTNNYSNLWTIVCSYYSMYYMSKAVLYELRYKIGEQISHKVTADALIVYVMNKLKESLLEDYEQAREDALEISGNKASGLIENFDFERVKRSRFQYSITETAMKSKAETSLKRAKEFVLEMEKLLD